MSEQLLESDVADADEMLRTFLVNRDAFCPGCNYNLRNLKGNRCPECGDKLMLRVNLVEPRLGGFIAGLVGLSAGAGFNLLLFLYFLIISILRGDFGRMWNRVPGMCFGGLLIFGCAVAIWVRSWRNIRNRSKLARGLAVIGAWGLTLLDLTLFILFVA
jgi:hypothetical protein